MPRTTAPTRELLARAVQSGRPDRLALVQRYLRACQAEDLSINFRRFVDVFWPVVSPSPLKGGWYLDALTDHLQHLPSIKRLLVNVPPRTGKSTLIAVLYPAWLWTHAPYVKFIVSSYSLKDLSMRDSRHTRDVITSPEYERLFSNVFQLRDDQNTAQRFTNDKLGFRFATSCDSGNIGEGGDVFIGDDLNNVNEVASDAARNGVINWWCNVLATRMNPGGWNCKVVVQQRCHDQDISGFILKNDTDRDWTHLVLPYEFDSRRKSVTSIWQDPRTTDGEQLCDLYSADEIRERKGANGLGPTGFSCQFNQQPAPAEGNVFKRDYFRTYVDQGDRYLLDKEVCLKEWCRAFIVTDLAISLKSSADYTVAQVWHLTPHNHLILVHQYRARVEGPDAVKEFARLCKVYQPDNLYVEEVAFQAVILQLLRQQNLPVKPLKPLGMDKKARAQRSLIKAECGQVWLPQEAPWLADWYAEVTTFPNAAKDDVVDCLAWAGIVAAKYPTNALPKLLSEEERCQENDATSYRRMMSGLDD